MDDRHQAPFHAARTNLQSTLLGIRSDRPGETVLNAAEVVDAIQKPRSSVDDVDRALRCKEALDPSFKSLIASAELAGWSGDESTTALFLIAVEHMKIREAKRRTDSDMHRRNQAMNRLIPRIHNME